MCSAWGCVQADGNGNGNGNGNGSSTVEMDSGWRRIGVGSQGHGESEFGHALRPATARPG
ncbi:hypothetical protein GLE_0862 [Lysobacter enzymogenes]|uniref:Uncharacterized protein n=1 Tax=Lysobacter enzymogenes TaxID=69 RepID=A0A0S2DCG9_LYSEN|nr:hypothetical protein GLE_0862 [Lysobacter enzymogenes]